MHGGVDLILVDKIVNEVKSQGVFDQFRKDSMADVDTKPAYQNLRQRVESSVSKFLTDQKWKSDLNKFQLREKLRKHIVEAGFLDTGVERIVDQVVNPKISTVFQPKIEDIAYKYLGIEKPHSSPKSQGLNGSLDIKTDLLPTDLEAVSPDSDKTKSESKEETFNESFEDKNEEFESPPFEPLERIASSPIKQENTNDSQLSGISGLTSQDSINSEPKPKTPPQKFGVNVDTQPESDLSEVSSNSRLSIVTNDENSEASKPILNKPADVDISEEAQMPKFSENSGETKVKHDLHFDIKREDIKFEGTERKVDADIFSFKLGSELRIKTENSQPDDDIKPEQKAECNTKLEEDCVKKENGDEIIKRSLSFDANRNEGSADMSLSDNESSRGSNSSVSASRKKEHYDLQSNDSQSRAFRPRPPSPPSNYMLQKPPSPNYYMLPIPPPPPTPPLPPPPGDNSYGQPPPPPTEAPLPPKPPEIPPLPPVPHTPPLPTEHHSLPETCVHRVNVDQSKPLSPVLREESYSKRYASISPTTDEQYYHYSILHSSSGELTLPTDPPPPPPPLPENESFGNSSPKCEASRLPVPPRTPPSPSDAMPSCENSQHSDQRNGSDLTHEEERKESMSNTPKSPISRPPSPPTYKYRSYSPKYHESPEQSKARPPSPKYEIPSSSNQISYNEEQESQINDDYINSPSPPPYEELRPISPTLSDLKSISSKENSFSLSETSQNETSSKPSSPFSGKPKSSSTRTHDSKHMSTSPQSKTDSKSRTHQSPLRPPSPPPSKSESKSEHRSSKSSSHHSHRHKSSKSSRDDRSSSHSHRSSSSSSSRNHTSVSSTHRSVDEKKHTSSSSSSRYKSTKSDCRSKDRERDKDRDKDRNKKKDDHSSARYKERRRKSTDSNDGDDHKQGSKHSTNSSNSRYANEKLSQGTGKESTFNSNSSGNFSSNSNSCNDHVTQRSSPSSRSNKHKSSKSNRDEQLNYFVIAEEEREATQALISMIDSKFEAKKIPIYLLDCDESLQNELSEYLTNIDSELPIESVQKIEYKTIYLNSSADNAKITEKDELNLNIQNNNDYLKKTSTRKRKSTSQYQTPQRSTTLSNENCLIVECIEYDKPDKMSRVDESRVDVSPTSSDLSVSSKENEFIDGKAKKAKTGGKMFQAEGIVRIEKTVSNGFKMSNQRYSSEDLYKPRPFIQRPRRREQLTETVIE